MVPQPERPAVDPGEERRLRGVPLGSRQVLLHELCQASSVLAELADRGGQPSASLLESGRRPEDADVGGEEGLPALVEDLATGGGAGDRQPALQAGDVPALGRRREDVRLLGRSVAEGKDRCEAAARQGERSVDLVDQQGDVTARAHLGHGGEFVRRPDAADRVVRAAQQVCSDTVGCQRPFQRFEVELVTAVGRPGKRRLHHPPADESETEVVRGVDRRVDHDPGAVRRDCHQHLGNARHHVRDRVDRSRVERPAVRLRDEGGIGAAETLRRRIAAVVAVERLLHRLLYRRGDLEVHLRHEGR